MTMKIHENPMKYGLFAGVRKVLGLDPNGTLLVHQLEPPLVSLGNSSGVQLVDKPLTLWRN